MLPYGYLCAFLFCLTATFATAFLQPNSQISNGVSTRLSVASDVERPPSFLEDDDDDDIRVTFIDEQDDDDDDDDDDDEQPRGEGRQRWENLNPKIKERLVEKGQAKAIANKKKREPAGDKKRRKFNLVF